MICKHCGTRLHPDAKFCSTCGQRQDTTAPIPQTPIQPDPIQQTPTPQTPIQEPSIQPAPIQQPSIQEPPIQQTPIQEPPAPPQPVLGADGNYTYPEPAVARGHRRNKTVLIVILVLVLAILAGGALVGYQLKKRGGSKDITKDSPYLILADIKFNPIALLRDNGERIGFDKSFSMNHSGSSENGDTTLLAGIDENTDTHITYVITPTEFFKIEEESRVAMISPDGKYVYSSRDFSFDEGTTSYYQYNVETKKTTNITKKGGVGISHNMLSMSPDGRFFAYTTENDRTGLIQPYLFEDGGTSTKLDAFPMVISNDGITGVYYDIDREELYYQSPKEKTVLAKEYDADGRAGTRVFTNQDLTQVLYKNENSYFFFEVGSKPKNLKTDQLSPITHHYTTAFNTTQSRFFSDYYRTLFGKVMPVSDLRDYYFYDYWSESVAYIDDQNNYKKIGKVSGYATTKVLGDTLYFSDNGNLYQMNKKKDSKATRIKREADVFVLTNGGDTIYYLSSYDTAGGKLRRVATSSDKEELIASDIIALFTDGKDTCYYISGKDFSIYAIGNKGEPIKIGVAALDLEILEKGNPYASYFPDSFILTDAFSACFSNNGFFYFFSEDGGLYSSANGQPATLVSEECESAFSNNASGINYKSLVAVRKDADSEGSTGEDDWDGSEDETDSSKTSDDESLEKCTVGFVFYNRSEEEALDFIESLPLDHGDVRFTYTSFFIDETEDDILTEDDLSDALGSMPDIVVLLDHDNELSLTKNAVLILDGADFSHYKTEFDTFSLLSDYFLSTFAGEFD